MNLLVKVTTMFIFLSFAMAGFGQVTMCLHPGDSDEHSFQVDSDCHMGDWAGTQISCAKACLDIQSFQTIVAPPLKQVGSPLVKYSQDALWTLDFSWLLTSPTIRLLQQTTSTVKLPSPEVLTMMQTVRLRI